MDAQTLNEMKARLETILQGPLGHLVSTALQWAAKTPDESTVATGTDMQNSPSVESGTEAVEGLDDNDSTGDDQSGNSGSEFGCPNKPPCPGHEDLHCGNGNDGVGLPGERQVNNPAQDQGVGTHITQSETSIAAFNSFVLFGFNDSNCCLNNNISGVAFSSDGGVTWCDCGSMPTLEGGQNNGDPVLAVDADGVFYYAHLGTTRLGQSVIQTSTGTVETSDRLIEIEEPMIVGVGSRPTHFQDKEWTAVGRDFSRPGKEAFYVTWTDFTMPPFPTNFIRFAKFTTGADPEVLIPSKSIASGPVQGSFPVVDAAGTIYVFYGQFPGLSAELRVVKSTDGGETFSAPLLITPTVLAKNAFVCGRPGILVTATKAIRTNNFPHAAVGPDGTLYVVWNDGVNLNTTGIDIYLAYSTNQGATWTIVQVTNGPTHEFMPSVIANASGAHIQYSKFQGTSGVGNGTFALFQKSFSIIGGLSAETQVSTVFSKVPDNDPTNFDTCLAGCYMGDYNQIITGPGAALLHAWGDNRNDPNGNNPDVFFIQN